MVKREENTVWNDVRNITDIGEYLRIRKGKNSSKGKMPTFRKTNN
jgi:hypothetical protein